MVPYNDGVFKGYPWFTSGRTAVRMTGESRAVVCPVTYLRSAHVGCPSVCKRTKDSCLLVSSRRREEPKRKRTQMSRPAANRK